jgi:hypothetical protein
MYPATQCHFLVRATQLGVDVAKPLEISAVVALRDLGPGRKSVMAELLLVHHAQGNVRSRS